MNEPGGGGVTGFGLLYTKVDQGLELVRRDLSDAVASACGVPPALLNAASTGGTASRESWRQFGVALHGMGEVLADEIRVKLGEEVTFDFSELASHDIRARSSAYKSMVDAGIPGADAARLAGLETGGGVAMTEATRASWTDVQWPPTTPVVSTADGRNWLGLYSDSSVDSEVQACLDAAVEKIASHVGFRISDTVITDFFATLGPGTRLQLSEPGVDWTGTLPVVKYINSTGATTTAASSRWKRDATAAANVICWKDSHPALYATADYPVQVVYTSKLSAVLGSPAVARVKLAVREALAWFWANRGTQSADAKLLDRRLSALLQSAKRR